jgi:5-methylcytosine-specific restriction enzyme A
VAWEGSSTKSSEVVRTAAWRKLRTEVLQRDKYRCQLREPGCGGKADQVDKILNVARGGNPLDKTNLQAACAHCNARKAQREATIARNAWKRRPERHPGLLP